MNVKKNFKNFNPRTGVSWRLNPLSVVRAGYGASTIPFPDNRYAFNYPVKQNYSGSAANGVPARRLDGRRLPRPGAPRHSRHRHRAGRGHGPAERHARRDHPDLHEGMLHSWNVAYQRQLPYLLTAEAAYVGNRGVDIVMDVNTNASMVYGSDNNGRPYFARFNRQGENRTRTNDNKTTYHGLQTKIDRRFRNGLLLTNSYTLQPRDGLRRRERRHRHADRLRA